MQSRQKVLGGRSSVKVAIVQTPPVYMDLVRSVERACTKIAEASNSGAELIVFSEVWLAGYPYWGQGWESNLPEWIAVRVRFYDSAVLVPSEYTEAIGEAAELIRDGDADRAEETMRRHVLDFEDSMRRVLTGA